MSATRLRTTGRRSAALRAALAAAAIGAATAAAPAHAQDFGWSAFGTVGWSQSDREFRYQRFVDDDGSAERDSRFGVQGDVRFGPQWSATVQLRLGPADDRERGWRLTPAWAFVGWRPADSWLLRAGRLRVPLYLHSESMDVGVTHDVAQLPPSMYSLAPTTDFDGLAAAHTWALGERDLSVDAYHGRAETHARFWYRDGVPGLVPAGAEYRELEVRSTGVVLTLRGSDGTWRAGVHRTRTTPRGGVALPVRPVFVDTGMGFVFWQVAGPGVETVPSIRNTVYTLGVEQQLVPGWRVTGEYARNRQHDTELGSDTAGGYVGVLHTVGRFTPYVMSGRIRASKGLLDWYERLTQTQVPAMVPGAGQINGAMRTAAESTYAIDQRTLALGTSFAIDASQKLKLQWQRTRIGRVSRLVDTPPGEPTPQDTAVRVWTLNYNFSF